MCTMSLGPSAHMHCPGEATQAHQMAWRKHMSMHGSCGF